MNKKIIVFDFDKTLTYSDTLFGFFKTASVKSIMFPFKVIGYFTAMIFAKFRIISNTTLKSWGIYLFLKNLSREQLNSAAFKYSGKINLNKLYKEFNFQSKDTIYVISASFTDYLKFLFPSSVIVVGSELLFKKNRIIGLKQNCFKDKKAKTLLEKGIRLIDVTYTDSYSDLPLACMSDKVIIIKGDKKYDCENIEEFNAFFKKNN